MSAEDEAIELLAKEIRLLKATIKDDRRLMADAVQATKDDELYKALRQMEQMIKE